VNCIVVLFLLHLRNNCSMLIALVKNQKGSPIDSGRVGWDNSGLPYSSLGEVRSAAFPRIEVAFFGVLAEEKH